MSSFFKASQDQKIALSLYGKALQPAGFCQVHRGDLCSSPDPVGKIFAILR